MNDLPDFLWAVGEECSDPRVIADGAPVRVDQLGRSKHLENQTRDLADIASLGVRHVRYGMPWQQTETSPGHYDWTLWDRALGACEKAGLEPIVDLLHFGLPDYCSGFADEQWIERFADYTSAFLARYEAPTLFTAINEPAFHAITAGYLGIWNDRLKSEQDYVRILVNVTLANLEALARIRADRDAWWVGAETYNVPVAVAPDAAQAAERQRALGWLVWDLHFGMTPTPYADELLQAVDSRLLERIAELSFRDKVVAGHDFYPGNLQFLGGDAPSLGPAERIALYEQDARDWYARYGLPFWISETSNFGLPVEMQIEWLQEFMACARRLREDGIPMNGMCWYSRGDQYDWDTLLTQPAGTVTEAGLYDEYRKPRPAAAAFRELALAGVPG